MSAWLELLVPTLSILKKVRYSFSESDDVWSAGFDVYSPAYGVGEEFVSC